MKKKKHAEHVNHERWLVSYADFITLLFAFFVVMFAVSQVDSKKVGRFTESFSKAVGIAVFQHNGRGVLPGIQSAVTETNTEGSNDEPPPVDLEDLRDELMAAAQSSPEMAGVQVIQRGNDFILRMPENIFFASGDDSVKDVALRTLRTICQRLRTRRVDVRVEGHTDNRPIRTARFRSNWELSTARATAVLAHLIDEGGMLPDRLSAAGYGEFHPIASNDTEGGRQQNRRVDLVISTHVNTTEQHADAAVLTVGDASESEAGRPPMDAAPEAEAHAEHPTPEAHHAPAEHGEHGEHPAPEAHASSH